MIEIRAVDWDHPGGVALREAQRVEIRTVYYPELSDSEPGIKPSAAEITVFYVAFDGERDAPWVEAAAPDVIVIHADPCWLAESDLDVGYVVATLEIPGPCVRPLRTFTWYGGTQYVYALRDRG